MHEDNTLKADRHQSQNRAGGDLAGGSNEPDV